MIYAWVDHDADIISAGHCFTNRRNRIGGDVAVVFGEMKQHWAFDFFGSGQLLMNAATVIANGSINARFCCSNKTE